jgi:hypothetical protein
VTCAACPAAAQPNLGAALLTALSGQTEEAIAAFEAYNACSPGFGLADLVIAFTRMGQR